MKIVLASTSKYRKELLSRLGLAFETAYPGVEETPLDGESPQQLATRLANAKALAVATRYDNAIIIGSDQVVCCGEDLLGKPGNHENAVSQLKRLSGREALFFTALCVHHTGTSRTLQHLACNPVKFRLLTAEVIERYLKKEQPYDCAGSAKSEGLGITLVEKIGGEDPNALIGLPLIALVGLLGEQGVRLP